MKYLVDVPKYDSIEGMRKRLEGNIPVLFTPEFTVTEYDPSPEPEMVPMVETGVLIVPKNYMLMRTVGSCTFLNDDPVDLFRRPELKPHCDPTSIKSTFDFSVIKEGDLVEVTSKNSKAVGYYYSNDGKPIIKYETKGQPRVYLIVDEIKSIEIVRRAR
jgi:hypothetical protein